MLSVAHLRDRVGDLDQLGRGVAAGGDDVQGGRSIANRFDHLCDRYPAPIDGVGDLFQNIRPLSPEVIFCLLTFQASRAIASERSISFESQVKPSPIAHHSTPSAVADCCSPTFHLPDLMNWITQTFQPRATARNTVPKAAVDFPFPSPVLTSTTDGARFSARLGAFVGTSL